jgi:mitochondrial fission protein ELM1
VIDPVGAETLSGDSMTDGATMSQDAVPGRRRPPRTWLLMGHKAGDNARILALAEALGWPFEVKRCVYRPTELITNLLAGPTLLGLVKGRSSPLEPPWPELIVSAGRRNEPIARWVRRRAAAAAGGGERVRLVHLGRPWAAPDRFDLIVATPQYHLPDRPNILRTATPLHPVAPERLAAAAATWAPRLAHLPRPRVAVLIGGSTGPYVLDRENGALLGYHANRMAARLGGALLVTTSARTPRRAIDAFEEQIAVPACIHRWSAGAGENPYLAYLALADRIVITCDSISMLAEAVAARKPVFIFDLARGRGSMRPPPPPAGSGAVRPRTLPERLAGWGWQPTVHRIGRYVGPRRLVPDLAVVHRQLVAAGRAVWLGQSWPDRFPCPLPPATSSADDLRRTVARVRALFGMPPCDERASARPTTAPMAEAAAE